MGNCVTVTDWPLTSQKTFSKFHICLVGIDEIVVAVMMHCVACSSAKPFFKEDLSSVIYFVPNTTRGKIYLLWGSVPIIEPFINFLIIFLPIKFKDSRRSLGLRLHEDTRLFALNETSRMKQYYLTLGMII